MTNDQEYVLSLLRQAFGLETSYTIGFSNVQEVVTIIFRNSILLTVYPLLPVNVQNLLNESYLMAIMQSVNQEYEGVRVLNALSDNGFSCIPLKGWELRKLYPAENMRQMADLDILVKPYEFERIKTIMENLGYSGGEESSWKHDSFVFNEIHFEMHKRLTDDSDLIQEWENEIWSRATKVDHNVHKMSSEDYYIFHFVHLHKDFMNGSLGLRRIVDTWLLQKQPVDMNIVRRQLEQFNMLTFHDRMIKLSNVVMGEDLMDENDKILLDHAFNKGIYGSGNSYQVGRIVRMGSNVKIGKLKSKVSAVFLPYSRMKAQFPVLQKHPSLLPYYWVKRILRFSRGNTKRFRNMLDYSKVSEEDYSEMKRFFEAGGVL